MVSETGILLSQHEVEGYCLQAVVCKQLCASRARHELLATACINQHFFVTRLLRPFQFHDIVK